MLPTNPDSIPCNPISSNCVIWQGSDVKCLNLCKGDSISDVVYKLATQFCDLLTLLNVKAFNLSCFNLQSCAPADFHVLLQFLIDKICILEAATTVTSAREVPTGTDCPDCLINIAPCFQYVDKSGDTITQMSIADYAFAIGTKICTLASQITGLIGTVQNHETRITILENTPAPTFTLPEIPSECVLLDPKDPTKTYPVTTFLEALEDQFCQYTSALGTIQGLYASLAKQCPNLNDETRLTGSGPMTSIVGWIDEIKTFADSFSNMWLTVCDMRQTLNYVKNNCCSLSCEDIDLQFNAILTLGSPNSVTLYLIGSVPASFTPCGLNTINFTDGYNTFNYPGVDFGTLLNNPTGITINLPGYMLTSGKITVSTQSCYNNTQLCLICEKLISTEINSQVTCPTLTITRHACSLDYTIVTSLSLVSLTVDLCNSVGTILTSDTISITTAGTYSGSFTGLMADTVYKIQITVVETGTTCPFTSTSTLVGPCTPPPSPPAYDTDVLLMGGIFTASSGLSVPTGNVTASSDVNPGNTTFGTGHFITGPDAPAQADALAKYNAAHSALATNVIDLSAGNISNSNIGLGLGVFIPGNYKSTAAVTVPASGTIILEGDGDYIFDIADSLTFDANVNMILINGAKPSRVFFIVGTATVGKSITTGATNTLKGNFILGNAGVAITVSATNNIEGRLLTTGTEVITVNGTATTIKLPLT